MFSPTMDPKPLLADHRELEYGAADGTAAPAAQGQGTFTRNLGALEAFTIVISIVIGSGVFTSPGSIDTNVPSPGMALDMAGWWCTCSDRGEYHGGTGDCNSRRRSVNICS
jgi:hypothetical protein